MRGPGQTAVARIAKRDLGSLGSERIVDRASGWTLYDIISREYNTAGRTHSKTSFRLSVRYTKINFNAWWRDY